MTCLEDLPNGLLIDVLACGSLDDVDLLNFGETCKRFYDLSNSNSVWKAMFFQKWSSLLPKAGKLNLLIKHLNSDLTSKLKWKDFYFQCKLVFDQLETIYHTYFQDDNLDDKIFEAFLNLADKFSFDFVFAVLCDIITTPSCDNLTCKYYAKKAYDFMLHERLRSQVMSLLNNEKGDEAELSQLIQGAILIERWFNPLEQHPSCDISNFISEAVQATTTYFEKLCSNQASTDSDKIEHLKFLALNHIFFEELKFNGNQGDYFNVNNSFIHQVIQSRRGIPILLSILYREIAMRIGLHLECVNNPGHFVLRWKVEELNSDLPTISQIARSYRYIDVFNRGRILHHNELPNATLKVQCATLNEVLHRVSLNVDAHSRISRQARNDVQQSLNAYNLCLIFEPDSHKVRSKRMQLNLNYNINLESILEDNEAIPPEARAYLSLRSAEYTNKYVRERIEKKATQRKLPVDIYLRSASNSHNVNYSVGMVMRHRRYDYICVIRGWNPRCKMSHAWVVQMGVNNMERGTEQPFYNVLVDKDGSERYAAEDSLELVRHYDELDHPEIGHYFDATRSHPTRHYIANSEVQKRYPEDGQFTLTTITEYVGGLEEAAPIDQPIDTNS